MMGRGGQPSQGKAASAAGRYRRRLTIVLGLTGTYMLVEIAGGLLTGSLALVADAAHMATDVFGLGLALFAIWLAERPATAERTYGYYRTEILASLANAVILFGVSAYVLYEAWQRFQAPPEVNTLPMLVVASVGLVVNLVGAWLLREGSGESLNLQGAYLEILSDLLGSIGVIVAALVMYLTGWWYADPLVSVAIGLFMIPRTWRLLSEAIGILLEGTPSHLNVASMREAMEAVEGVVSVHDLHVWTITSGYVALSAHAHLAEGADPRKTLRELNAVLGQRFGIEHTTIQLEEEALDESESHP